jgi:hypothetical protein
MQRQANPGAALHGAEVHMLLLGGVYCLCWACTAHQFGGQLYASVQQACLSEPLVEHPHTIRVFRVVCTQPQHTCQCLSPGLLGPCGHISGLCMRQDMLLTCMCSEVGLPLPVSCVAAAGA